MVTREDACLELATVVFSGIHLRAISQEVLIKLIFNMYRDITFLKLLLHLPGTNELNNESQYFSALAADNNRNFQIIFLNLQ